MGGFCGIELDCQVMGELLYDELVDIRFIHDSCVVCAFFENDAILMVWNWNIVDS
jgi:hypothetical protein